LFISNEIRPFLTDIDETECNEIIESLYNLIFTVAQNNINLLSTSYKSNDPQVEKEQS
jgi:hypothetical protein